MFYLHLFQSNDQSEPGRKSSQDNEIVILNEPLLSKNPEVTTKDFLTLNIYFI
jgi:hypothetical protein